MVRTLSSRLAVVAYSVSIFAVASCGSGSPTAPSSSPLPTTFLSLVSSPGDRIGEGFTQRVGLSEAIFSAQAYPISNNLGNRVSVSIEVSPKDRTQGWSWLLRFTTPAGQPLQTGTYEGVGRWPGQDAPGMDLLGRVNGCSSMTARFVIDDLALGRSDGYYTDIDRLHMTFEQRCVPSTGSLVGEVSIIANPWQ